MIALTLSRPSAGWVIELKNSRSNSLPPIAPGVFTRIATIQTAILVVAALALAALLQLTLQKIFITQLERQNERLLELLHEDVPQKIDASWCKTQSNRLKVRVSVISSASGALVCDPVFTPAEYSSILDRPEIAKAIANPDHRGSSVRESKGLSEKGMYSALHLPDRGLVLRVGLGVMEFNQLIGRVDRAIVISAVVLALILALTLHLTARYFIFSKAVEAIDQKSNQLRADFLANVSHEFKTPLTSIKGFSDTILADVGAGRPTSREFAEIIGQDADRLLSMVNDLLDLSAIDSGAIQLSVGQVSLEELTADVVKRLSMVYRHKQPMFKTSFETTQATADPLRLAQVLLNLAGNAVKYGPDRSPVEIHWDKEKAVSGVDELVLRVADRGPGISEADQARVFERFFRGSQGAGRAKGTGLGLAIVKQLVEMHGGRIELLSREASGSEFVVRLPQI